jgi:phosphoribosylformylglycinamidine (FGAM) synthase-like enzyme
MSTSSCRVCAKWDVEATVIGEVTDGDRCRSTGMASRRRRAAAHRRPRRPGVRAPVARPDWQDDLIRPTLGRRPAAPDHGDELRDLPCCELLAQPNLCDKSWITDQYDRYVQGNTVLAEPSDSGMMRVDEETGLGVAVATDATVASPARPVRRCSAGARRAYRNVAVTGATPLAVSDCLNFGSPEDPAVMWQFARPSAASSRRLRSSSAFPVTGGNVSFYNQTGATAILPTPVVAVLGVIDDVTRRTPTGFVGAGPSEICCCSATPVRSSAARSGRTWSHGHLGGSAAAGGPASPRSSWPTVLIDGVARRVC